MMNPIVKQVSSKSTHALLVTIMLQSSSTELELWDFTEHTPSMVNLVTAIFRFRLPLGVGFPQSSWSVFVHLGAAFARRTEDIGGAGSIQQQIITHLLWWSPQNTLNSSIDLWWMMVNGTFVHKNILTALRYSVKFITYGKKDLSGVVFTFYQNPRKVSAAVNCLQMTYPANE